MYFKNFSTSTFFNTFWNKYCNFLKLIFFNFVYTFILDVKPWSVPLQVVVGLRRDKFFEAEGETGGTSVDPRSITTQAPPGKPDHRTDHRKEGCCEQCMAQACSSDSTSSQGESSLIRSTRCCMIVCTIRSMYEYIQVWTSPSTSMYEFVRVCISIIRGHGPTSSWVSY